MSPAQTPGNGTAWTRVSTAGPADRGSDHMAYDATRHRTTMLLFKRVPPNADQTYNTNLWEWTGHHLDRACGQLAHHQPIQPLVGGGPTGGLLLFDGGVLQGTISTWL